MGHQVLNTVKSYILDSNYIQLPTESVVQHVSRFRYLALPGPTD